ncbi:MAG: hypothetical protein VKO01_04625 [Cyanobacteriota bacterium]|nr:hypothetical protein [Cyanobacteriota bacterium]
MSKDLDLTEWIAEVHRLQQQVTELRQQRDKAYNSAANWQRLYDREAQQRRQERAALPTQLAETSHPSPPLAAPGTLPSPEEQIQALTIQCQQLRQALEAERQAHEQTRLSLTMALAEALDRWKQQTP